MEKKLLTVNDVKEICQISKSAAYDLVNSKNFPKVILNKNTIRVFEKDLYKYLENKKIKF